MNDIQKKYEAFSKKLHSLNRCIDGFISSRIELDYLPVELFLEVSHACNINCKMCNSHRDSRVWKGNFLSKKLFHSVEPILEKSFIVHLQGFGEPLINRNFNMFVESVKKQENFVEFFTNGMALTRSKAEMLVKNRVDSITLSLDGACKETVEYLREGADFDRIVKNLTVLDTIKKEHGAVKPRIEMNFIGMNRNFHELPELPELAKKMGVSCIRVKSLVTYDFVPFTLNEKRYYHETNDADVIIRTMAAGRLNDVDVDFTQYCTERMPVAVEANNDIAGQIVSDDNAAGKATEKPVEDEHKEDKNSPATETIVLDRHALFLLKQRDTCSQPWATCYVSTDGNVAPCCFYRSGSKYSLGNINDEPLEAIWNNDRFKDLRERMLTKEYPEGCLHCIQFNLKPLGISFFQFFKDTIEEEVLSEAYHDFFNKLEGTDLKPVLGYDKGYYTNQAETWRLTEKDNGIFMFFRDEMIRVEKDMVDGDIDSIKIMEDKIVITGWVIVHETKTPPRSVIVFIGSRALFSGVPHYLRHDVAAIHGAASLRSGFMMNVPKAMMAKEENLGTIRIIALFDTDRAGELCVDMLRFNLPGKEGE